MGNILNKQYTFEFSAMVNLKLKQLRLRKANSIHDLKLSNEAMNHLNFNGKVDIQHGTTHMHYLPMRRKSKFLIKLDETIPEDSEHEDIENIYL